MPRCNISQAWKNPAGSTAKRDSEGEVEAARPQVYNFHFSADKAFRETLKRLGEVLGVERPESHMPELFQRAMEFMLDRKDPRRKRERRLRKNIQRDRKNKPKAGSRYIPSEVRERMFERANYQCEYRGLGGVRCSQRTALEIDHIVLFAWSRNNDETNLRVLCRNHNRWCAEKALGRDFIQARIRSKEAG